MPLFWPSSVRPFHLASRFHCNVTLVSISPQPQQLPVTLISLDVQFIKSVEYIAPILAIPERMLHTIEAVVQIIKAHFHA